MIKRGSRGERVRSFQQFLIDRGYLDDVADGVAGPLTEDAIRALQRDYFVDGIAGEKTLAKARGRGWVESTATTTTAIFDDELVRTAGNAGIPPRVLFAVRKTESSGKYDAVRFEPHLFLRKRPDLVGTVPFTPGPKNFSVTRSETDIDALMFAFSLDKDAAVRSSSFGAYQVLGGFLIAAYGNVSDAMRNFSNSPREASEKTLVAWFKANPSAVKAANKLDFTALAKRYNGRGNYKAYAAMIKKHYDAETG
tara:strand:- start:1893 stop:2648 length:756 start_codon:yes stop_codon:yes gene_type:complete